MVATRKRDRRSALDVYGFAPEGYAKGLLPFKGKGELLRFRDELELVQLKLRQQAIDLANAYNQELLKNTGIVLRPHWRKNEIACSLRWRDRHQHRMGLRLWEATVAQAGPGMREALVDMEVERCLFNGAVSVVSRQLWRVRRVLADIEHAESYLLANSRDKNTGNIGESDTR